VAGDFEYRCLALAKKKSELTVQEEVTERAALGTETEVVIQSSNIDKHESPSITRLFKRKNQPSPIESKCLINIPRSFTRFEHYDREYRTLVGRHNDLREQYIGESMQMADQLVVEESKSIAMIQDMISAFADSQSDFACALNSGSTNCRSMANKISPSTEGHNSLMRVHDSISVALGRPHLYKNFWFGVWDHPIMLFGYIPDSDLESTMLECVMRLFKVLVKYDPLLSLASSNELSDEQLSKLVHDIETCWDPEEVDGGAEVVRLLTTDPRPQGLALHFLQRTPRPLVEQGTDSSTVAICELLNTSRSYSERKFLSMVFDILIDSSKAETPWWARHAQTTRWFDALTWKDWQQQQWPWVIMPRQLRYMDFKAGKFVEKLESW